MEDLVAYFNGKFIEKSKINLPVDNVGFTRGYGVYECFRCYGFSPFKLSDYLHRLKNSCKQMLIAFPSDNIESIVQELIERNQIPNLIFRLYLIDHPTKSEPIVTILCNRENYFDTTHPNRSLSITPSLDQRVYKTTKTTSYASSLIALKKARLDGFDDILYIGKDQIVHELSRANFFAIKNRSLYTPKRDCLEGITKKYVIETAKLAGYSIYEQDIPLSSIEEYEEVFCSATIRNIRCIHKIGKISYSSHQSTLELKELFNDQIDLKANNILDTATKI